MRVDRRHWLTGVATVLAGAAATGRARPSAAPEAGAAAQTGAGSGLPAPIARLDDIGIDESVEPALVFVARTP